MWFSRYFVLRSPYWACQSRTTKMRNHKLIIGNVNCCLTLTFHTCFSSSTALAMALAACSSAATDPFVCKWIRKKATIFVRPQSSVSDRYCEIIMVLKSWEASIYPSIIIHTWRDVISLCRVVIFCDFSSMFFSSFAMPSSLLFRSWDLSVMSDSVERKQSDSSYLDEGL